MSIVVNIPAHERNRLHLFALNITDADARKIKDQPGAPTQFLGVPLNETYAEIVRLADLDELGLGGYLIEGYSVPDDILHGDMRKIGALEGYVLVVLSAAFDNAAVEIRTGADLTHVGSYAMEATSWQAERDLRAEAARPGSAPEDLVKKRPSDAAMMGRVATIVLLVLFALTGLMVWIAG